MLRLLTACLLLVALTATEPARAQGGHGPSFGLATPTLPQGAWQVDATLMSLAQRERALMARATIRYGLTADLQLNLSIPQAIERIPSPPSTRIGTMMAGLGDIEASVLWRFHVQYPGVGQRFESTLYLSGLYPIRDKRGGLNIGPGVHAAVVTGYASRSIYVWGGGGYQHHFESEGDRPGDLYYLSAVFGWRPPFFQVDYPKPDIRFFIESVAEFVGRDQANGQAVPGTGGERVFVGPSFLGLYRAFGLGFGVLFPVYQDLGGTPAETGPRLSLNLSYFF